MYYTVVFKKKIEGRNCRQRDRKSGNLKEVCSALVHVRPEVYILAAEVFTLAGLRSSNSREARKELISGVIYDAGSISK